MSEELTVEECKLIISEGRRQLTEAQERIAELERSLKYYRLEAICYENDVDRRDELIRELYDNLWTHVPKCAEAFAGQMRDLGIDIKPRESHYERLFGTPEKAAWTLANIATEDGCEDCALLDATCSRKEDVWLEWLRGDA